MKNNKKFVLVLFIFLLSSITQAELKHPTCKIHLANMNTSLRAMTTINEAKKDSSIIGLIPRKKTIAVLKKHQNIDVNLMLERAFSEKGFITSFQSEKSAAQRENFSIQNYTPKRFNSDYESKDIRVDGQYYAEEMGGHFGLTTMTKRKKYYNGFATAIAFSIDLTITDPMLSDNKTSTFFKYTAQAVIKDDDIYAAFEDAIAEALREAPRCEIL